MARRTPEELLAQRDAWMARKAAREAGQDVPLLPPLGPGEEAPVLESAASEAEVPQTAPEAEVVQATAEPEVAQPVVEQPSASAMPPAAPKQKRTPEEIKAQREAFMAARAAKAAGVAAPAPAAAPVAQPAAAVTAPAAAKPAPAPAATAAKPAARPRPARKAPAEPEPVGPITRREFLNYAWLASLALFTAESVGLSLWFAFPNFLEGQFGGKFPIGQAVDVVPEVNSSPVPFTDGKFWLVNVDTEVNGEPRKGVVALFKICTHLGCLYDWVDVTTRFECPCHGSKFQLTGDYIEGPARRSLDRFVIQAVAPDGSVKESTDGQPLIVNDDDTLIIDTGLKVNGTSDIVIA